MIWAHLWYPAAKDKTAPSSKAATGSLGLVLSFSPPHHLSLPSAPLSPFPSPPCFYFFIKWMLNFHQKEIRVQHSLYSAGESLCTAVKESLAWNARGFSGPPGTWVLALEGGLPGWIAAQAAFLAPSTAAPSWSLGLGHLFWLSAICSELLAGELFHLEGPVCSPGFSNNSLSQLRGCSTVGKEREITHFHLNRTEAWNNARTMGRAALFTQQPLAVTATFTPRAPELLHILWGSW